MGFRFRRTARLGPIRFNITGKGLSSVSLGGRGATMNIPVARKGGVRTTVGIPGSGISYSEQAPTQRRPPAANQATCREVFAVSAPRTQKGSGQAARDGGVIAAVLFGVPALALPLLLLFSPPEAPRSSTSNPELPAMEKQEFIDSLPVRLRIAMTQEQKDALWQMEDTRREPSRNAAVSKETSDAVLKRFLEQNCVPTPDSDGCYSLRD